MRALLVTVVFSLAWGQLGVARAETCPEVPDDEVALRRSMAKEWFAKAEEAEAAGDKQGAIRRYACSLGLAPHPSTAYNLGTVAEKSGDLAMALDGFRSYLKLAPEATDRPTIEARIFALEAKISDLRKEIAPKIDGPGSAAPAATPPGGAPAPGVAGRPPGAAPPPAVPAARAPGGHGRRIAAWSVGGVAVAALGAGVAFNLEARSKMSSCASQWNATKMGSSLDLCDEAKPFAYGSYALYGAAGAAAAVSALLFLWQPEAAPPEEPGAPEIGLVGLTPTIVVGGAAVVASGRF
jgi:tetratricopeptide (TPR) repeat protein